MRRSVQVFLVLIIAMTACAEVRSISGSSELGGEWRLTSGSDTDGDIELPPLREVTLEIDGDAVSGHAGCNQHGGTVDVDDGEIDAEPGSITLAQCKQSVMKTEHRYLAALEAVDTYAVEGDLLTMKGPEVELVYESAPSAAQASFDGTEWRLESLIEGVDGEGLASSTLGGSLTFDDEGTFEGFTGCRDIGGRWEEDGELITTSEIDLGARRCGRMEAEQDEHVVSVLEAGFTVNIVEARMTLETATIDLGLAYRAEG